MHLIQQRQERRGCVCWISITVLLRLQQHKALERPGRLACTLLLQQQRSFTRTR
ncbi:hypothetical protein OOT46_20185 [Aquabacterium sp. A7-Y]|uniref:hypothetical protein n=1 Tax=Aquabacterium sp. A7-Y TaxID=1349605 RepID=UPI00223E7E1C|nr:hypothetical protein [Aquabacterium sp. A7-Y]MCW7540156.1 hypothetical protein [Aquabacterium sp. A7-Y]